MNFDFEGKSVLVTGASRGIGSATAALFAQHGARVALHYNRAREAAEEVFKNLAGTGHVLIQADLTQPDSAQFLFAKALEALGTIDVVVNNAGIFELHPVPDVDFAEWQDVWQRTLAINLLGPANLSYCAARHMMKEGSGKIINVSSRGAFRGEPDAPAYGASKAGLNALSQSLAKALAPANVFVYCVAPGWVETDMAAFLLEGPAGEAIRNQSPLGRAAQPVEIARTIAFLASEGTDYLTGCIVDANGASYLRT